LRAKGLIAGLVVVLGLLIIALLRAMSASRPPAETGATPAKPAHRAAPVIASPPPSPVARRPDSPPPRPSSLASPPTPARPAPAAPSAPAAAPLDEVRLMKRLREIKESDSALAVELAREGNRRFPESADAPERASILIHALVALDRANEARGEAEDMVNRYANSTWVREVERYTGAHPHRDFQVTDGGLLQQK
jgi:hypothetical protein